MTKIRVLFVCLGNICRSPLAEAVFSDKVRRVGLHEDITLDSCGTGGYHVGHLPDPRSIAVAKDHYIPMDHHARQLTKADLSDFDYVIGMDDQNIHNIERLSSSASAEIFKMRRFDPAGTNEDVPDPFYGGDEGFEKVYQMLDRSSDGLLAYITKRHGLNQS
ncbi:MAG: low molecular weight protein-tyrosine-phosphatase [Cyclobacteriaceae bacterium]